MRVAIHALTLAGCSRDSYVLTGELEVYGATAIADRRVFYMHHELTGMILRYVTH